MSGSLPPTRLFVGVFLALCVFSGVSGATNRIPSQAKSQPGCQQTFAAGDSRPTGGPGLVLVLSGGGARGFAQIGVLKALEEAHLQPDLIVGTSIGAVIGGLFAAGYSAEEILRFTRQVDWNSLFSDRAARQEQVVSQKSMLRKHIFQIRLNGLTPYIPPSLTYGQRILFLLYRRLLGANLRVGGDFDRLPIAFRAIATDLTRGERVVLERGDLAEAICASLAFPLLFAPFEKEGKLLVDGGISDNLPVDVARDLGAGCVLAVDVTAPLRRPENMRAPWEIADQVTTIMMRERLAALRAAADVLVRPDLEGVESTDFRLLDTLVQRGYRAMRRQLPRLQACLARMNQETAHPPDLLAKVALEGLPQDQQSLAGGILNSPLSPRQVLGDLARLQTRWPHFQFRACIRGDVTSRELVFQAQPAPGVKRVTLMPASRLPDSLVLAVQKPVNEGISLPALRLWLDSLQTAFQQPDNPLFRLERVQWDSASGVAIVHWNPGRVDAIEVRGNRTTRPYVVLREMPLKPGAPFSLREALKGIQNIYSTGLFYRVLLHVQTSGGRNLLRITVKERDYTVLQMGARVSSERKSQGFLELLHENFLGTATRVSLLGSVGELVRKAEASIFSFRLFRTYLTSRLRLYYHERWDDYYQAFRFQQDYRIIRRGFRFGLGQQIARLGLILAELRWETVQVTSRDGTFPYEGKRRVRSFRISSVVDRRDRLPFPRRGIYNRWFWETGSQRILGSSRPFLRLFLALESYHPLGRRLNLHPSVQFGTGDLTVPFTEWYFVGGQHDFPGLHERELFGRQFLKAGLDWRYQLSWRFPLEGFLVAHYGLLGVWRRPDEAIRWKDFKHSASFSFALNSFLGPIEMTIAHLFPEDRNLVYFSLGFQF
ncbi:MAG: hypothetical protein D6715_10555 [Calditrichaeota bacterium]|nr:MAG: hypothetical protein D6715_10555 [Calditrichota bacterium]